MILNFICENCHKKTRKIFSIKPIDTLKFKCEFCNGILIRNFGPPSANSIEIIDNGIMEKKVEFDLKKVEAIKINSNKIKHNICEE